MKRGLKCDTVEEDDFFDDQLGSPYSNFCSSDRKKRRGIIEKRRRDRINTSLSDLKRLVPDACNKQNSAKLEKAEILQITVDFLRRLHQEGYVLMAETRAAENRRLGFHECLTEVSRFISTQSDLPMNANTSNINVPNYIEDFKRRLINHLQLIGQKRDSDMKSYLESTAQVANETPSSLCPPNNPQTNNSKPTVSSSSTIKVNGSDHQMTVSVPTTVNSVSTTVPSTPSYDGYHQTNPFQNSYYTEHNNIYYKQSLDRSDTSGSSPNQTTNLHQNLLNSTNLMSVSSMTSGSGPQNESQSTTSPSLVGTLEETEMSTSGTPPNLRPSLQALMNQVYNGHDSLKLEPPFECSSPTKSDFWLDSSDPSNKKMDELHSGYFYTDPSCVYNYFVNNSSTNGSFYSGTSNGTSSNNGYPTNNNSNLINGSYYNQHNPTNFPVKQNLG